MPVLTPVDGEIWKEYKGRQFSNFGRMKHRNRISKGHHNTQGYLLVTFEGKKHPIHRIIMEAFSGLTYGTHTMFVDHIDQNKTNNNIENLRWVTPKQNALNRPKPKKFKHCLTCTCDLH